MSESIVLRGNRFATVDYVGTYLRIDYVKNSVWVSLFKSAKDKPREFEMVTGDEVTFPFSMIKFRTEESDGDTVYFTPSPIHIHNTSRYQETDVETYNTTMAAGGDYSFYVNDQLEARCLHAVLSNNHASATLHVTDGGGGEVMPIGPGQSKVLQTGGRIYLENLSAEIIPWGLLGVVLAPPRKFVTT